MMKIAFVHYHLNTGGVTTVIRQQAEAIQDACETLTLSGSAPPSDFPGDVTVVPGLGYDTDGALQHDPADVAEEILAALHAKWPDGGDILHVHNPTLAKNRNLLEILNRLRGKNLRLFLQIHDFAEDGRPLAYFTDPYISDCHYGVINSRDYQVLLRSGLTPGGLHIIPNMIHPLPETAPEKQDGRSILYPIRAIRRKNLGEAILLSLFFQDPERLTLTLPPTSPPDMAAYRDWKRFVSDHRLSVRFDAGLADDFSRLVADADFMITTSITEGFGFLFLEPWTAGRLLWGRKLPDTCRDFEDRGVRLDHLYSRLGVPVDWIDRMGYETAWKNGYENACRRYGHPFEVREADRGFDRIITDDRIDFGLLNEKYQKQVLRHLLSVPAARSELTRINPFLEGPGRVAQADTLIAHNRAAVLAGYSRDTYRDTLLTAYRNILSRDVIQRIRKPVLLSSFLTPSNFSLLKWCAYEPD